MLRLKFFRIIIIITIFKNFNRVSEFGQMQWLKPVILGSLLEANLGKKLMRPHLKQWLGAVLCACHPRYTGKQIGRCSSGCPRHEVRPYHKNKKGWQSDLSGRVPA
jgi:hypothetical protein